MTSETSVQRTLVFFYLGKRIASIQTDGFYLPALIIIAPILRNIYRAGDSFVL
jgi:hypothetical protein